MSKILFCHSKIKFISSRHRVISSMYLQLLIFSIPQFSLLAKGGGRGGRKTKAKGYVPPPLSPAPSPLSLPHPTTLCHARYRNVIFFTFHPSPPCQRSLSFACSILAHSRKTLNHELSKVFLEHAQNVSRI